MAKTAEIGKSLEQISGEARAKLISKMRGEQLKAIPKKYVVGAIELYEKKGKENERGDDFYYAASIAENAGMYLRAVENYLRCSHGSTNIYTLAEEHGLVDETIEIYEKIIQEVAEQELKLPDIISCKWVQVLSSGALPKKLQDVLWNAGFFCSYGVNRPKEAVEFYERGRYFEKAAEVAEKAGMKEKAIDLYVRAGELDRAAIVAEKAGMYEKALNLYLRDKDFYCAAGVAEKAGMKEKARELYELFLTDFENSKRKKYGGEFGAAARAAKKLGLEDKAKNYQEKEVRYLEREGPLFMAVEAAEEAGMLEKARKLSLKEMKQYEKWGHFDEAAEIAKKLGLEDKVKLYEELVELQA